MFDFSAAPVAVHRDPEDHSFFGLPGLKIFGALFQAKHLVALLAATLFLGWKGFALGVIVWIFYKLSQKPGAPYGYNESPSYDTQHEHSLHDLSCSACSAFVCPAPLHLVHAVPQIA